MKTYLKNLLTVIILITLTLSLFTVILFSVMSENLTSAKFYKRNAEKAEVSAEYITNIYRQTQQSLVFKGTLSGLDRSVFEDLLTPEITKALVNERIENLMNGTQMPTLETLKNTIRERAEKEIPEVDGQNLDEFIEFIGDVVASDVEIPFFSTVYPTVGSVLSTVSVYVVIISPIVIIGLFIAIWFLTEGLKKDKLKWMSYPVTAAGLMFIATSILTYLLNDAAVFNFSTQNLRAFLSCAKTSFATYFLITGTFLIGAGLIVFFAPILYKKLKGRTI